MAEARYRGQKVVAVLARLRRQRRSSPTSGSPPRPAPTARWRWRWATSCSRSSSSTGRCRTSPTTSSASPTCRSWSRSSERDGGYVARQVPHRRRPAAQDARGRRRSRRCCSTPATGEPVGAERLARLPLRRSRAPAGGTSTSATSTRCSPLHGAGDAPSRSCAAALRRARRRAARRCAAACRSRRVGGHLVTTVFDLLLAQYGVGRDGLPGTWPTGYDDADAAVHAGLAGADHRRARRPRPSGSAREFAAERRGVRRPLDDPHGRRARTTGSTPTRSTARSSRSRR